MKHAVGATMAGNGQYTGANSSYELEMQYNSYFDEGSVYSPSEDDAAPVPSATKGLTFQQNRGLNLPPPPKPIIPASLARSPSAAPSYHSQHSVNSTPIVFSPGEPLPAPPTGTITANTFRNPMMRADTGTSTMTFATSNTNFFDSKPSRSYNDPYNDYASPKYLGIKWTRKRFYILICLLVAAIIGAILLGVLIPIVGKDIASSAVSGADITVNSLLTEVLSDTIMSLTMNATVTNNMALGGTIAAFPATMSMVGSSTPVANFTMPQIGITASSSVFVVLQVNATILNGDAFIAFVQQLLLAQTMQVQLTGSTSVTAIGLTFNNIPFDKTLQLTGMDGLTNLQVDRFDLSPSTDSQLKFVLDATIVSPSVVGVVLGVTTFELFYQNVSVGTATSVGSVSIIEGSNYFTLNGVIVVSETANMDQLNDMFSIYMGGGALTASTKIPSYGLSSPLLAEALSILSITTTLPALTVPLIHEVDLVSMSLWPVDNVTVYFEATIDIGINNPVPNVSLDVQTLTVNCSMYAPNSLSSSKRTTTDNEYSFLSIDLPPAPALQIGPTTLRVSLNMTLSPEGTAATNFIAFVKQFLTATSIPVHLLGIAGTTLQMGTIGNFSLSGVPVDVVTPMPGLDNLSQNTVTGVDLSHSTATSIVAEVNVTIWNPSTATVSMGPLTLALVADGQVVGSLLAADANLVPGNNSLPMSGTIFPVTDTTTAAVTTLFNNYLIGVPTSVVAQATTDSLENEFLNQAFQGFGLSTVFPGNTGPPLISGVSFSALDLRPDYANFDNVYFAATTNITVNSPLGPDALLVTNYAGINANVYSASGLVTIGTYVVSPLVPTSSSTSSWIVATLPGNLSLAAGGVPFENFVLQFVNDPSVQMTLAGTASVQVTTSIGTLTLGGIPVTQTVTIAAMGGLQTIQINELNLPSNASPMGSGINLAVVADLFNPTFATLAMGNLMLDVTFMGTYQGYASVENLVLAPGNNAMSGTGLINPAQADLNATGIFFSNYINSIATPVTLKAAVADPATTPQWLTVVVSSLAMNGVLNPPATVNLIQSVNLVPPLNASLPAAPTEPALGGTANIIFQNPFTFTIDVETYAMVMTISNRQNQVMGSITVPPWSPVNSGQLSNSTYQLTMIFNADLDISNNNNFVAFIQDLLTNQTIPMYASALANITALTGAGTIILTGVNIDAALSIQGLNHFNSPSGISILQVDATSGSGSTLEFLASMSITSGSTVNALLGPFVFELMNSTMSYMGTATQDSNIYLPAGQTSYFSLPGQFDSSTFNSQNAIANVLSNYMMQDTSTLYLIGSPTVPDPSPLQSALNSIQPLVAPLPGAPRPVIKTLIYGSLALPNGVLSCTFYVVVSNPLSINITIDNVNSPGVYYSYTALPVASYAAFVAETNSLGSVNYPSSGNAGIIPPDSSPYNGICTSLLDLSVTDNPAVILDVGLNWVLSSRTSMYVAFQASMTVTLDRFVATIQYENYNILLSKNIQCP